MRQPRPATTRASSYAPKHHERGIDTDEALFLPPLPADLVLGRRDLGTGPETGPRTPGQFMAKHPDATYLTISQLQH